MTTTMLDRPHTLADVIRACGPMSETAREIGVSRAVLYKWAAGRSQPTWHHMIALCERAGVDPRTVRWPD